MTIREDDIRNALKSVRYPGFSRDIVSFGIVKEIALSEDETRVQLVLTTNEPAIPREIKANVEKALRGIGAPNPKVLIDKIGRASCRERV